MPLLAVALAAPNTAAALAAMHQAAGRADLAELRLDLMAEFDLPRLLAGRPLPVIVTCRPLREGGRWPGSEAERLAVLRQAAALGADYVDLEWDAAGEIAGLDRRRTQVILSRHRFDAMPTDLAAQAESLWAAGADGVKLVGMAQRLADCTPVLRLLAEATRPTIAIAMGQHGLLTRVLAFRYPHALLSFAAPDSSSAAGASAAAPGTAPGQITLAAMRQVYRAQTITRRTLLVGLLAQNANESPLVVEGNRWLSRQGLNAALLPLQAAPGEFADDAVVGFGQFVPLSGVIKDPASLAEVIDALRWLLDGAPE